MIATWKVTCCCRSEKKCPPHSVLVLGLHGLTPTWPKAVLSCAPEGALQCQVALTGSGLSEGLVAWVSGQYHLGCGRLYEKWACQLLYGSGVPSHRLPLFAFELFRTSFLNRAHIRLSGTLAFQPLIIPFGFTSNMLFNFRALAGLGLLLQTVTGAAIDQSAAIESRATGYKNMAYYGSWYDSSHLSYQHVSLITITGVCTVMMAKASNPRTSSLRT